MNCTIREDENFFMICRVAQKAMEAWYAVMVASYKTAAEEAGFPHRGRASLSFNDFTAECAEGYLLFSYMLQGKIIGILRMKQIGNACKIKDIAVLPAYQRRGYGYKLLCFAKEAARDLGAERIELGMFDDDAPLRHWYETNGFVSATTFGDSPFKIRIMEYTF